MRNPITGDYWVAISDGDARGLALFKRHYSYRPYKDGRSPRLFVGPGEKSVLMTTNCDALFVWRKFRSMDHQQGINCSVFRNESPILSSILILEAMEHAARRWPGERMFTYVNPAKLRGNNPGYCFKKAGWKVCGETKANHLIILEILSS